MVPYLFPILHRVSDSRTNFLRGSGLNFTRRWGDAHIHARPVAVVNMLHVLAFLKLHCIRAYKSRGNKFYFWLWV